jgi:sulfatase maturation enzyme AslB (radical SAM superfamily)
MAKTETPLQAFRRIIPPPEGQTFSCTYCGQRTKIQLGSWMMAAENLAKYAEFLEKELAEWDEDQVDKEPLSRPNGG